MGKHAFSGIAGGLTIGLTALGVATVRSIYFHWILRVMLGNICCGFIVSLFNHGQGKKKL